MPTNRTADFLRELLVRHLATWLPTALHRSRRVTVALAWAGADGGGAEAVLRVVADHAAQVRGRQVTILVLADEAADLPARLGSVEAELPPEVTVHLLPGGPGRLPVALKAASVAGSPLFCFLDLTGPAHAEVLRACANGRNGEVLLHAASSARPALGLAGFPLVAEVTPVLPVDGGRGDVEAGAGDVAAGAGDVAAGMGDVAASAGDVAAGVVAFGSRSDRSLEAVRDALWTVGADLGVRYRDPADPAAPPMDVSGGVALEPLARNLLAELRRSGPQPVTDLRRYTLTTTAYRATDANQALATLLTTGEVTRERESGRLAGDELITPTP
ncbi:hypothetical protein [Micromonospora sp. NPDC005174]|uniref:hypothetical protein n=1 Tax=Micromonospora sp. NPDC005174 TaxID=3157018 RepID=UPI0033A2B26D